jgi:hypothetical protein
MTMLGVIRSVGVMRDATPPGVLIGGVLNGDTFPAYTRQLLVPALRPGDVVVTPGGGQSGVAQGDGRA